MKLGDVVRFRGRDYCVGKCKTNTSIELVELKQKSTGLWVSRTEVHEVPQQSRLTIDSVDHTSMDSAGV